MTHSSAVRAARSDDPQVRRWASETLVAAYWKPVYKYIRFKWRAANEEAKDLTQGFFAQLLERELLERYDPAKAAFRTYLRVCLDGFVSDERLAGQRQKRGGGHQFVSLDYDIAENELSLAAASLADAASDPDRYFHREWVRSLFSEAVESLRAHCLSASKEVYFLLFERYDLAEPEGRERLTYDRLAGEFGLTTTQVTNYLAYARREFRRLALASLRAATGSEEEYCAEARQLFGIDPP